MHLGIDDAGFIVASELTESPVDDASVGVTMIEEIVAVIERFTADGACDKRAIYQALTVATAAEPTIVIPPKKTATVDPRAIGPTAPAQCRHRKDRRGRPTSMAEGVRCASAGPR